GEIPQDFVLDVDLLLVGLDRAVEDLPHRDEVLLPDRLVETPVLADRVARLRRRVAAAEPDRPGAVRNRLGDQEGADRDREEHCDHREQPPDDEARHHCSILTSARGSSASRTPSPNTLIPSTARTSIPPGISVRCIALGIRRIPSPIIVPQEGFGGWT